MTAHQRGTPQIAVSRLWSLTCEAPMSALRPLLASTGRTARKASRLALQNKIYAEERCWEAGHEALLGCILRRYEIFFAGLFGMISFQRLYNGLPARGKHKRMFRSWQHRVNPVEWPQNHVGSFFFMLGGHHVRAKRNRLQQKALVWENRGQKHMLTRADWQILLYDSHKRGRQLHS